MNFYSFLAAIPVTDPENKLLPLQFAVDPGPDVRWGQDEDDPWVIARLTMTDKEKLIFLNEYLEIKNVEVTYQQPSITENTYKEMNGHLANAKKYDPYESDDSLPEGGISCTGGKNGKSRAARQLQSVAKQFGSIGRSMSKKLKHIGNIARRGGSFKGDPSAKRASDNLKNKRTLSGLPLLSRTGTVDASLNPRQVVVALLNTEKKHEYQQKLIENYLVSAINRFENDKASKDGTIKKSSDTISNLQCINPGCTMFSAPSTSYLCSSCYTKQKQQEFEFNGKKILEKCTNGFSDGPVVVSGKSAFYTETDKHARESLEKIPLANLSNGLPECKNSVFYDKYLCDNVKTYNNPSGFPERKAESVSINSHSVLKTIEESASS